MAQVNLVKQKILENERLCWRKRGCVCVCVCVYVCVHSHATDTAEGALDQ